MFDELTDFFIGITNSLSNCSISFTRIDSLFIPESASSISSKTLPVKVFSVCVERRSILSLLDSDLVFSDTVFKVELLPKLDIFNLPLLFESGKSEQNERLLLNFLGLLGNNGSGCGLGKN